jgi:hypothetical protein
MNRFRCIGALCAAAAITVLCAGGCEEEDTRYEFHVTNNGTATFYISCWEEITVTGNYVSAGMAGVIILSGKARDEEIVELCVEGDHCTMYGIVRYADFDVTVTPSNDVNVSDR